MRVWEIDPNKSAASDSTLQRSEKIDEDISDVSEESSNISLASSTTWIESTAVSQHSSAGYCTRADESGVESSLDSEVTEYDVAQALCEFQSQAQQINSVSVPMGLQAPNGPPNQIGESLIYLRRVLDIDLR